MWLGDFWAAAVILLLSWGAWGLLNLLNNTWKRHRDTQMFRMKRDQLLEYHDAIVEREAARQSDTSERSSRRDCGAMWRMKSFAFRYDGEPEDDPTFARKQRQILRERKIQSRRDRLLRKRETQRQQSQLREMKQELYDSDIALAKWRKNRMEKPLQFISEKVDSRPGYAQILTDKLFSFQEESPTLARCRREQQPLQQNWTDLPLIPLRSSPIMRQEEQQVVQYGNDYKAWAMSSKSYLGSAHPMTTARPIQPTLHNSMNILSSAQQPNLDYIRYSPVKPTAWLQPTTHYAMPMASANLPHLPPAETAIAKLPSQLLNPLSPMKNDASPMRLIHSTRLPPIASVNIAAKPILLPKPIDTTNLKLVGLVEEIKTIERGLNDSKSISQESWQLNQSGKGSILPQKPPSYSNSPGTAQFNPFKPVTLSSSMMPSKQFTTDLLAIVQNPGVKGFSHTSPQPTQPIQSQINQKIPQPAGNNQLLLTSEYWHQSSNPAETSGSVRKRTDSMVDNYILVQPFTLGSEPKKETRGMCIEPPPQKKAEVVPAKRHNSKNRSGVNNLCRIEEESGEDIQANEAVMGTQNTRQMAGTTFTSQPQPLSERLPILSLKQEEVRECFEKSPILKNINNQKSRRPNSEPGTLVPNRQMSAPMMAKKTSKIPSTEYSSAPNFHGFIQRTGLQISGKSPEIDGPHVQQGTKLYTDSPNSSTSSRPTPEPKATRPSLLSSPQSNQSESEDDERTSGQQYSHQRRRRILRR